MDGGAYQTCTSPKQYFLLAEGQHTFQVRAKDAVGNTDPTPAEYTWTVDSLSPEVIFNEKPARVTNDRTPKWAWTIKDANPSLDSYDHYCRMYERTNYRTLYDGYGCLSPLAFEAELPDADYAFWVEVGDRAGNYGYSDTSYFEVDNVAPKFVSGKPTGKTVRRYASVVATFDDNVYNSAKFVNIYKKGSSTPLAISDRYTSGKRIKLYLKNALKRGTWYTVKVTTGVNDGANKLAKAKTWHFKTKG